MYSPRSSLTGSTATAASAAPADHEGPADGWDRSEVPVDPREARPPAHEAVRERLHHEHADRRERELRGDDEDDERERFREVTKAADVRGHDPRRRLLEGEREDDGADPRAEAPQGRDEAAAEPEIRADRGEDDDGEVDQPRDRRCRQQIERHDGDG